MREWRLALPHYVFARNARVVLVIRGECFFLFSRTSNMPLPDFHFLLGRRGEGGGEGGAKMVFDDLAERAGMNFMLAKRSASSSIDHLALPPPPLTPPPPDQSHRHETPRDSLMRPE